MGLGTALTNGDSLTTVALATVFIILGGCRVLLIKLSANQDGKFDYLPVAVNLCAEFIKLLTCSVLSLKIITEERIKTCSVFAYSVFDLVRLLKWSLPGLLYFFDNLIAFYVVASFEPAIVVLLNNFGIISTALLFRLVLKRKLSQVQWASLVILFLSIVSLSQQSQGIHMEYTQPQPISLKNSEPTDHKKFFSSPAAVCTADGVQSEPCKNPSGCSPKQTSWHMLHHLENFPILTKYQGYFWILLQCFASSLANIYNEKIFKEGKGFEDSIYVQNTKLYFFGVIFNSASIIFINKNWQHAVKCGLFSGFNVFSYLLVLDSAIMGLTISLILKFRDNMFHVLSAQVTTLLVITLSLIFMGFEPSLDFFVQAPTVMLAIFVFNLGKQDSELPTQGSRTLSSSDSVSAC